MTASEVVQSANSLEAKYGPILFRGLGLANMAHVRTLRHASVISEEVERELLYAITEVDTLGEIDFDPAIGDAYVNYEKAVAKYAPDTVGWLRAGRARRDATNIAFHIAVRHRLLDLWKAVISLAREVVNTAYDNTYTLMPDYTYLQQAQPTTLGHYLLGFVYPMLRDMTRLEACYDRVNRCPGGIGSSNGTRLGLDRELLAELLGFDGPVTHARDAMWQADLPIEIASTTVTALINLSRLAEDLQVWCTQEFGLIELGDDVCRSSAIMPQKKNPYALTYIRGLANMSVGTMAAMANVGRTPTGQPDNRIFAYGTIPNLLDYAINAVKLMERVIAGMEVSRKRMFELANGEDIRATDEADELMLAHGIPYTEAYRMANRREVSMPFVDATSIISTRTGIGGAAPKQMREMVHRCRSRLGFESGRVRDRHFQITSAEDALERECYGLSRPTETDE